MSSTAPAGWYPQPDGTERWWDGQAWTAHSRPVPAPPSVPTSGSSSGSGPGNAPGSYGTDAGGAAPYATWNAQPQPYAVAPKNPAVSLLASFFVPGLGSMLNGEVGKGIGILVGYFVCLILFFFLVPLLVAFGLWVYGMVDAYQGAQAWNRQHGILG